ncbi:hypothetical protein, partial [Salmonella sp. SAL4431]|uniref:hypothetical protein n=1 Tax=Salmonella sp. SAL4431 TaxID=3159886 RepID=UPI0039795E63
MANYPAPADLSPTMRVAAWGYYEDAPTVYPGEASLGRHLVESLVAERFDVAQFRCLRDGEGMAHAYTFFHRRIMNGHHI